MNAHRNTAQDPFGGVVRETDAAVVEEAGEGRPALEHVVHGLGEIVAARQFGPLLAQPLFQISDQRRAQFLQNRSALWPLIERSMSNRASMR
jgi:hypothetical protein